MSKIDLKDRPIVITGASAGIGRAVALLCAREGMPVVAAARRGDRLESLVDEIHESGGRAAWELADVTDKAACERLIARAEEDFGQIYAVFANAGYGVEAAMHEMEEDALRKIFEVNFWGSMNVIQPAVPRLLEAGEGHIILNSSCVARFSLPYYGAYCATKAAQHHIGRAMRLELEPHGVHVSTVHPIGTRTEFFDKTQEASNVSRLIEHSSERFMQSPERVAKAVVKCLRKPVPEVWTSNSVRIGVALSAIVPRMSDLAMRKMVRERLRQNG